MDDLSLHDVVVSAPDTRRGRRSARQFAKRKTRRRWRTFLSLLITLAVIGGAALGAYVGLRPLYDQLTEPNDFTGTGTGTVQVKVEPGDTGVKIAKTLYESGVVKSQKAFVDAVRANPESAGIQPGTYQLREQMSAASALELLLSPASRLVAKVTVREGLRVEQVLKVLADKGGMDLADLQAASKDAKALGLPASAKGNPEGYLFPATYEIEPDTTEAGLLKAMVQRNRQVLAELKVPAARQREVLVKASIVQAEAGKPEDFGKIARVIENRLVQDMALAMDSTVHFGTGTYGVFTTAEQRADDNPFNTYKHKGLPAGPIGSPGKAAIQAVLKPTEGEWLYFTAVNLDTGETKFAQTGAEHQRNVDELHAWMRANR